MKKIFSLLTLLLCAVISLEAQTNIFPTTGAAGIGTLTPNASSLLDITSTTKGMLAPRMTLTQRDAILTPATGLLIYQTNSNPGFYYYSGSVWKKLSTATAGATKSLNNLTAPTAINQGLLPGTNNTLDLGSSALAWRNGYFGGQVGIGTATPLTKLDVAGDFRASGSEGSFMVHPYFGGSSTTLLAAFQGAITNPQIRFFGTSAGFIDIGQDTSGNFTVEGNDNNRFTITQAGNVGIGTAKPFSQLSNTVANISGSTGIGVGPNSISWSTNTQGYALAAFNGGLVGGSNGLAVKIAGTVSDLLDLSVGGSQTTPGTSVMMVKGNGNVGLGTTPLILLDSKVNQVIGTSATVTSQQVAANRGTKVSFGAVVSNTFSEFSGMKVSVDSGTGGCGNAGNISFNTWECNTSPSRTVMSILGSGNVVIGQPFASPGYRLTVAGKVICTELKVQSLPFPDYVFADNYKLMSLKEVENHIKTYRRLPGMPSATDIETNGMEVGRMQTKMVEKVEENTLYIIQLSKENEQLKEQLNEQAKAIADLRAAIEALKK